MDSSAIRNDRYETATASTDRGDKKNQRVARAAQGGLDGSVISVPSPSNNVDANPRPSGPPALAAATMRQR